MQSKYSTLIQKAEFIIGFITSFYLLVVVIFIKIPNKIFELWEESEWWFFTSLISIFLLGIYCLSSVLINDYIKEISKKDYKTIINAIGIILFMIIAGIFNFSHRDSLILTFILIPIALIFYLFLNNKLSKITDYSYTKGWFDGYKRNLRGYGKSYDDGYSDGSDFKN